MTLVLLDDPGGRDRWEFEHDGRRFLVLRHRGRWVVTDALCPHRQGALIDGLIRGDALICPSHWYAFDLTDGTCRTTPDHTLGVYHAVERDGRLAVDIPPQVHRSWAEVLREHARGVPPGRTSAAARRTKRA